MTKRELMKEFEELQEQKNIHVEGIYYNSNKSTIENAIECLKCPDEMLEKLFVVFSLKYPNFAREIESKGDFKKSSYFRLYVYNSALQILND